MKTVFKSVTVRLIALFLAVILLGDVMGVLAVNATSEETSGTTILKGTPVLDGQVDDIYLTSLTLREGVGVEGAGGVNAYATAGNANTAFWNNTATIRFLCDSDYLYICADIADTSVVSRGKQYVLKDSDGGPWMNDCCEFRLSLDGGLNTIKVGIDAFGFRCYGLTANMAATDYSNILYKTSVTEGTGYVIEVAVPCSDGGILDLLTAGKLGFKLQLNDYEYDSSFANFAADYAGEGPKGLVYYDLSDDITSGDDGSGEDTAVTDYKVMSFGTDGTGTVYSDASHPEYGNYALNTETGAVDITYCSAITAPTGTNYMAKLKFAESGYYTEEYKYMRVLYSADHPDGVDAVELRIYNDGQGTANGSIQAGVTDTNGEYVLSTTKAMADHQVTRFVNNGHQSITFNTTVEGGSYSIKAIYFFKSAEDADAFVVPEEVPEEEETPSIDYKELSFGAGGTGTIFSNASNPEYGNYELNTETGAIDITYCSAITAPTGTSYMAKLKFAESGYYTEEYKYMRVLYSADHPDGVDAVELRIYNDGTGTANGSIQTGVTDTNGEYVLSTTKTMADHQVTRFVNGYHQSITFNTTEEGGSYSVKAIYFFKSAEDADAFVVPPEKEPEPIEYKKLSFLVSGNYKITSSPAYGNWEVDEDTGVVAIMYGPDVTESATRYMIKPLFDQAGYYEAEYKYLRVLYSAQNPDGVESVDMKLRNDSYGPFYTIASGITNTNGEFKLTDTWQMKDHMVERYVSNMHMSLMLNTLEEGGRYLINAFYFFKSEADANNFDLASEMKTLQINGNDISNYQIVIPENGFGNEYENAKSIMYEIYASCGVPVPIVYDSEAAVSDYEILIGNTNRTETRAYYGAGGLFDLASEDYSYYISQYRVEREGNKVIFVSGVAEGIDTGVSTFIDTIQSSASPVNISEEMIDFGLLRYELNEWPEVANVENPVEFNDSFTHDHGYWTTDSDKQGWTVENGILSSGAADSALSYLQVFETNVSFEAKWKAAAATSGQAGLLLRHTADDAYVKVGYDFEAGGWFIDSREGSDFMYYRLAFAEAAITADQWYTVKAVVDGTTAKLYVDDVEILSTATLTQLTPGKIGVFADGVSASLDDAAISLLSGQGTIMRNVVHTKLPGEDYHEGGSAWELNDGTIVYEHHTALTYQSSDSGKTWTKTASWTSNTHGYPNILRLQNGEFLHIVTRTLVDDQGEYSYWWGARVLEEDGTVGENRGVICERNQYADEAGTIKMSAGNMNDKVTQMSDGRIFYVQTMNTGAAAAAYGYPVVYCDIYYSDDNGVTWTKSETSTRDMVPEEDKTSIRIGEGKILETADGTLRFYSSWNDYGCIVYSESTDNGVTWGPIQKMTDYVCSKSSMQFAKDTYADNETTYYMVWVKNDAAQTPEDSQASMPRSHLVLTKSVDGINWTYLGDIWRWESKYYSNTADIQHIVDPFITVTEDYLIIGSGISEEVGTQAHHAQREHLWSVRKDTLTTEHSYEFTSNNDATCTADGTMTAVCSVCGDTQTVTDEGSKLGHAFSDYVSGSNGQAVATCQHAGCVVTDTITDVPVISQYSISLKGNIAVNYYMILPTSVLEDDNAMVQFTMADGDTVQVPVSEGTRTTMDGTVYYVFDCQVAAKEMTDEIKVKILYGDGQSTEEKTYSVKGYAEYLLNDTTGAYKSYKLLVTAMLQYGAYAQQQFGYNTDNLANAGVDALDYSSITADALSRFASTGTGTDNATFYATSLLLKSETTLRVFFQVAEGATLAVTKDGNTLEVKTRNDLKYVDVENIAAKDLGDAVTLTVSDGTETATVTVYPLGYCYNVLSAGDTYTEPLVSLVKALYLYYAKADACLN